MLVSSKKFGFFMCFVMLGALGFLFFGFFFGNFLLLYIYSWRLCIYFSLFCLVVLISFLSCCGLFCFSIGVYV